MELSNCNQIKQLRINVPMEVQRAAHLILLKEVSSSLIKKIIEAPNIGKKIVTVNMGHSVILVINKPC